jgi:putative ATP-binding cassette transporter
MSLFFFLLRASRRIFILAILAGIIGGASGASLVALINAALSRGAPVTKLFIWGFVGLGCLVLTSNVLSQILLVRLAQGAIFELRMHLSRRILAAPLRHLEEVGAPRLLAALTDDVLIITNALLGIPPLCINVASMTICLVYLGWLSLKLLLIVLGFLGSGVLGFTLLERRALRSLQVAREEQDTLFKHFRALTEGTKELKLHRHRRHAFLFQVLQSTATAFRRHVVGGMTTYAAAGSWGQLLFYTFLGLLLFVLPTLHAISLPLLTSYTLTIFYIMGPLNVIVSVLPNLGRANVSLRKVESLGLSLAAQPGEDEVSAPPEPEPSGQQLELVSVTHSYSREGEEDNFILGPIDLTFYPGELIFLVGGNGSGKTTLAKLLTGLYAPESGEILFRGQPITDENREYYRQHFSMVFSDFYLFESLLGLDTPKLDGQAREYLAQLQLSHKVQIRDGTLSTTALSQGQRKRLALLTAYLEDRPFYVFDEWAADQDPLFKEIFYAQLLAELKRRGKTVLVITHDEKYYHLADRIIKLDYGKVDYDQRADVRLRAGAPRLESAG